MRSGRGRRRGAQSVNSARATIRLIRITKCRRKGSIRASLRTPLRNTNASFLHRFTSFLRQSSKPPGRLAGWLRLRVREASVAAYTCRRRSLQVVTLTRCWRVVEAVCSTGGGCARHRRDVDAKRYFDGLSYSQKQRHVLPIEQAKTAETRQRRIDKALSMSARGLELLVLATSSLLPCIHRSAQRGKFCGFRPCIDLSEVYICFPSETGPYSVEGRAILTLL
jgi:hypothetical protein